MRVNVLQKESSISDEDRRSRVGGRKGKKKMLTDVEIIRNERGWERSELSWELVLGSELM
jgi:hypothetical protein